ncbi:MAG: helix-turn-helix domain-containing protein [Frankiaceae bacterium]
MSDIGARLRAERRRRGLSQRQLVEGLPLTISYVSLIEAGRRHPTGRTLPLLAERLGCPVERLTDDELAADLRLAEEALRAGDTTAAYRRAVQGTGVPPLDLSTRR